VVVVVVVVVVLVVVLVVVVILVLVVVVVVVVLHPPAEVHPAIRMFYDSQFCIQNLHVIITLLPH
jgi:hypothetical protein